MNKKEALLSKRFENNGKPAIKMKRDLAMLVNKIKEEIRSRQLELISHAFCPLCRREETMVIAHKDRFGLPLELLLCESCGLVFSEKYLGEKSANIYYGQYYNQFKNNGRSPEEMFKARTNPGAFAWKRHAWVKDSLQDEFSKIKVVMEIGSNDGCNLYPYHQNGCRVFGCDYDEERMSAGRKAGITLLKGGANELIKTGAKADLVILSHSLGFIPDIDSTLKAAMALLLPGGKIYIETPGIRWWNTAGHDFLAYLQFENIYYFEWRTLKQFAIRNQLKIVKGDEFIRVIMEEDDEVNEQGVRNDSYGNKVYEYLCEIEARRQKNNPWWKRIGRLVKRLWQ